MGHGSKESVHVPFAAILKRVRTIGRTITTARNTVRSAVLRNRHRRTRTHGLTVNVPNAVIPVRIPIKPRHGLIPVELLQVQDTDTILSATPAEKCSPGAVTPDGHLTRW